jgi:hypothetical protein
MRFRFAESVAVALDGENVGVVDDAVDEGGGTGGVIAVPLVLAARRVGFRPACC